MNREYREYKEYKKAQRALEPVPLCEECGHRPVKFHLQGNNGHSPMCSQFKHIPDDHYDSACMNGRCKYCNPDYKPTRSIQMSDEEYEAVMDFLHDLRKQDLCS